MQQLSMFDPSIRFPSSYEDIDQLFHDYIYEDEKDADVFSSNETKNGRSYFFYGKKVFTFSPDLGKGAKFRITDGQKDVNVTPDRLPEALADLKRLKRDIFRGLITEKFACCNDFKQCSAAGSCIHPEDRFYNGCFYRTNLEAGRNFFKEEPK